METRLARQGLGTSYVLNDKLLTCINKWQLAINRIIFAHVFKYLFFIGTKRSCGEDSEGTYIHMYVCIRVIFFLCHMCKLYHRQECIVWYICTMPIGTVRPRHCTNTCVITNIYHLQCLNPTEILFDDILDDFQEL